MVFTYVILPQGTTMSAFLQDHDADVAGIKQVKRKPSAQPIRSRHPASAERAMPVKAGRPQ
jgi:hypothetical protein